eukprot:c26137_g1_i1 orf=499-1698(-)
MGTTTTASYRHTPILSSLGSLLHIRSQGGLFQSRSQGGVFHIRSQGTQLDSVASPQYDGVDACAGVEAKLAQRLTHLLAPEGAALVTLPFIRQAMDCLLATVCDLRVMVAERRAVVSQSQQKTINDFVDRSLKLLDACNEIREAISDVQSWKEPLETVLQLLDGNQVYLIEGQLRRAKSILDRLNCAMNIEKQEELRQVCPRSLWRWNRHFRESQSWQIWRSWHGNFSRVYNTSKQVIANLSAPRYTDADTDDPFVAAVYALHTVSVFFLSTTMSAFPCHCKALVTSVSHSGYFLWDLPLTKLQERALEEFTNSGKRKSTGFLWELHQISLYLSELIELVDRSLLSKSFPLSGDLHRQIRSVVKQLNQHAEELERDLAPLDTQVVDFFHGLIAIRTKLF